MRCSIFLFFCLFLIVGCGSPIGTKSEIRFSLDDVRKMLSAVSEVDEQTPDLDRSSFILLHRRLHHNLYNEEIGDYISRNGKKGLLKGLCDFRELGSIYTFMQSSGKPSSTPIRYSHIFLFMSRPVEERETFLPYGIEKNELDELVARSIEEIITEL